ncbi:MAG TPA: tail fiber protein, partial [Thermoanaerobaculia bacterium]|nr:tail fiber protein [Thermoanaerobaculia bacterium]
MKRRLASAPVRVTLTCVLLLAALACRRSASPPVGEPGSGVGVSSTGSGSAPTTGGGELPSGTVIAFAGAQVPAGWTICDGRATSTGHQTLDLRGRFVMGAD